MSWTASHNPLDGNWYVCDGDEPVLNFYRDKETAESVVMVIRGAIEESEAENKRLREALEKYDNIREDGRDEGGGKQWLGNQRQQ